MVQRQGGQDDLLTLLDVLAIHLEHLNRVGNQIAVGQHRTL